MVASTKFRFVFWDVLACKIIVRLHGRTSQKTNLNLILCSDVVTIIGLFLLPPLFPFVGLVLLGKESARDREGDREACLKQWERCEISSSHGGEYDVQSCLLGYTAV
jgi:hypothetical protein